MAAGEDGLLAALFDAKHLFERYMAMNTRKARKKLHIYCCPSASAILLLIELPAQKVSGIEINRTHNYSSIELSGS